MIPPAALAGNPLIITFDQGHIYTAGNGPDSVAAADLTGDGKQDLIVANSVDNTVSVFLGNGDGTFQPQQVYPTCTNPVQVVVTDMNQDGKPDLVVLCATAQGPNWAPSVVSVLLGNGDGTFQVHKDYSAQIGTWQTNGEYVASQLLVGDLNSDSYPDVITLGYGDSQGEVHVLLNAGAGQNGALQPVMLGDAALTNAGALLDINGNSKLDLAYVINSSIFRSANPGGPAWAFGDGTGHFINDNTSQLGCQKVQTGCNIFFSIAAGDVNDDGKPDLVVSTTNGPCTMLNEGNGNFSSCQSDSPLQSVLQSGPTLLADLNNSGRADLLTWYNPDVGNICEGITLQALLGYGDGTFQTGPTLANNVDANCGGQTGSFDATTGDFNGDSLPDVAMTLPNCIAACGPVSGAGAVEVFLNTSNTPDQAPIANNSSITVNGDSTQVVSGIMSASSPLNNPLKFAMVSAPAHGSVEITDAASGAFTYTPAANFPSSGDSFTFNANDAYMDSNTATVAVMAASGGGQPGSGGSKGGGGLSLFVLGMLLMFYLGRSVMHLWECSSRSRLN